MTRKRHLISSVIFITIISILSFAMGSSISGSAFIGATFFLAALPGWVAAFAFKTPPLHTIFMFIMWFTALVFFPYFTGNFTYTAGPNVIYRDGQPDPLFALTIIGVLTFAVAASVFVSFFWGRK